MYLLTPWPSTRHTHLFSKGNEENEALWLLQNEEVVEDKEDPLPISIKKGILVDTITLGAEYD